MELTLLAGSLVLPIVVGTPIGLTTGSAPHRCSSSSRRPGRSSRRIAGPEPNKVPMSITPIAGALVTVAATLNVADDVALRRKQRRERARAA